MSEKQSGAEIDFTYGGENGYSPDLSEWVTNQSCMQRNLIPILVAGFGPRVPEHEIQTRMLRSIIELHAFKISGFQRSLDYDVHRNVIMPGHPGTPKCTYGEKYCRPIDNFHRTWMSDWLAKADDLSREDAKVSVLFFEPNSTLDDIVEAYLCENMYPRHLSGLAPRRDITVSHPPAEVYVEYHANTRQGETINLFAKQILKTISIQSSDPDARSALVSSIASSQVAKKQ